MRGSSSKVWLLAGVISAAIIIAILSMPEVLEPLARTVVKSMGPYWLLAVLIVGLVHGLKPDEHTWPITVSYALMQRNAKGVLAAISVFAGALTLVWTLMSALVGQLMGLLDIAALGPYVDIIVGATMIGVATYLVFGGHGKASEEKVTADYKLIWIHGLAASFGGDFFVVLVLTAALVPAISPGLSFLIGLMFGAGSWAAQTIIVMAVYKGIIRTVKEWSIMASAGRMALGILGLFMIGLGIYSFLVPGT